MPKSDVSPVDVWVAEQLTGFAPLEPADLVTLADLLNLSMPK